MACRCIHCKSANLEWWANIVYYCKDCHTTTNITKLNEPSTETSK